MFTCTVGTIREPNTPFTNSIMWIISALFGRKIGMGPELSTLFRCCNYPHYSRIGMQTQNLWTQFQNNADNFQGAVKGHLFPLTLIRLFEFFLMGARKTKCGLFSRVQSLWTQFLLNYPHNSYADNWGMLLWKGYKFHINQSLAPQSITQ